MLAEDDWRAIEETLHLHSVPGLVESIQEAREEGPDAGSTKLKW